jgi:diaminohydroxyphosphoribosylaminopyrimidine deaminase/5-amino-6-(5-phosphoribosylamino)uracil reductase
MEARVSYTVVAAPDAAAVLSEDGAWRLLQALAASASRGTPALEGSGIGLDEAGTLRVLPPGRGFITLRGEQEHGWEPSGARPVITESARALLELYVPLCVGEASATLVLAHLGQSLDGRVATVTGASRFVTGPEDLRHMHRLRALFDAVMVGARTARLDDPELTTRLVPGRHPTRVVLDPRAGLDPCLRLLSDGRAPTIVVHAKGVAAPAQPRASHVDVIEVGSENGLLCPHAVLAALRARGLRRIFIEGGGITVSRFLQAGALGRLQLTIAPKIIGSGTPALSLHPIEHLTDAITLRHRRFSLGADVLYDCELGPKPA